MLVVVIRGVDTSSRLKDTPKAAKATELIRERGLSKDKCHALEGRRVLHSQMCYDSWGMLVGT